ncbi:MAG: aminoacyl-tRNA hydrolase [Hyphomicrobiaceae bacterium]|nr:aminoacyl-tRNA hydrolase [Hyphomicrobiaceae bacterium]MCC0023289.1 aminoacyl-tRNA hydrolase [Hyphomicrobiaceae bacterium]
MYLIAGLGNPGEKYAGNRHNVGMMAIDTIAARHHFPPFKSKFRGLYADGRLGNERVFLLKPQTFMNNSGDSVSELATFFKIPTTNICVIYDELDLAPGKIRVKRGGGNGGHNGLRSIDPQIGTDYLRVRIGIGHPGHKDLVTRHVLADFAKADQAWLEPMLTAISENAELLVTGGADLFMNRVSLLTKPQPEKRDRPANPPAEAPEPAQLTRNPDKPEGPFAAALRKLKGLD